MSGYESPRQESTGISNSDREQTLLDDLRAEIARLADAVERQNEILADCNTMEVTPSRDRR